jgi:cell division protein FtsB
MKGFQGRNKFHNWYYSKPILFILLILAIFLVKGVWGVYQKSSLSYEAAEEVKAEARVLEEMRDNLALVVARLETGSGLEAEIRRQLPVVKEGEGVISLVGEYNNLSENKIVNKQEVEKNWWELILDWFKFKNGR